MILPSCVPMGQQEVVQAFLAAPPLIDEKIKYIELVQPSWISGMAKYTPFPLGSGNTLQRITMRGEMPPVERGFDKWKTLGEVTGCNPCPPDACGYNWTQFGGTAFERHAFKLMKRDFTSPNYCVEEIQTTLDYEQVMEATVKNLRAQTLFFKEQNVLFNAFTQKAKKFVVDSGGAKINVANPYVYPNIGNARLSALNITIATRFYNQMRRIVEVIPYDLVDGAPIYAMEASLDLLASLYRDDPSLRRDVNFSSEANAILGKYNFRNSFGGMFVMCPIDFPRRFNIVNGEPFEVVPYVNGIPTEIGSFTGVNPAYENATHEEVTFHGKSPIELYYQTSATTVGGGTSFGEQPSWLQSWKWSNPETVTDPFQKNGRFISSATIGIDTSGSEGIYALLVERPPQSNMASFYPSAICPPAAVNCGNEIPDTGCPCPLILSYYANPVDGSYVLTLAVPLVGVVEGSEVQFGITTGGYVIGTVADISTDGKSVIVTFPEGTDIDCDIFTTIFCDNTLGCFAEVTYYNIVASDNTRLSLRLSNPVKGEAADTIQMTNGNGNVQNVTIVSQDYLTNTLVVDVGGSAYDDTQGGVISICIPTAADSTCEGCSGVTYTQCET